MKETFDSVLNSVKDRFTNPFLGTFLFVWIIRNWYLVYAIFAFDKECTIDDKLNYIKDYFNEYNVYYEFVYNTCWAIGVLIVMYILLIGVQYLMRTYQLLVNKANARFDKIPVESKEHYYMLLSDLKKSRVTYKNLSSENDLNIAENERYKSDQIVLTAKGFKLEKHLVELFKEYTKIQLLLYLSDNEIYLKLIYTDKTYNRIEDIVDKNSIIKVLTEVFYDVSDENNNLILITNKIFLEYVLNKPAINYPDYNKDDFNKRFEQVKKMCREEKITKDQENNILEILKKLGLVSTDTRPSFSSIGIDVCINLIDFKSSYYS